MMKQAIMTYIKFTAEDVIATSYLTIGGLSAKSTNDNDLTWYYGANYARYTGSSAASDLSKWYANNNYSNINANTNVYSYNSKTGEWSSASLQTLMKSGSDTKYSSFNGDWEYKANGVDGHTAAGFYAKQQQSQ